MAEIDWAHLYELASKVTLNSYSPYSKFPVGAAGICKSGNIITGCNVENASFGLTLCAECSLVSNMHTTGEGNSLVAVAIVGKDGSPLQPCGRCRQLLMEAGGEDLLVNKTPLKELLPDAFKPEQLP